MAARIICLIMGILIAVAGTASADDRRILDVLLKKGIISRAEYEDILKEAAASPPDPPKLSAESKPDESVAPPQPIGSYKDLERVPGGIENLRKNDYRNVFTTLDSVLKHNERLSIGLVALKAQYNADNTDRKANSSTAPADTSNTQSAARDENGFRIRAAEIYVTGRLTPWSTYYFEADFARQNEIVLNSMYMDFYAKDMPYLQNLYPYISQIRVGQFREPFGIEQGTSQGLLDFVNRAYYTDLKMNTVETRPGDPTLNPFGKDNGTGFLQQLDIGIELTHKAPQLPWAPEFQWAVINGAGRNFNDNNADKDLTGRLIFTPTEGMKLYFAGYTGTSFFTNTSTTTGASTCPGTGPGIPIVIAGCTDVKKSRQGAMYTYIPPSLPELKLQGEYIDGRDNGFRRRTWYQYVLYRPFSFLPNFEAAYRYEQFTIDANRNNSTLDRHTLGFNYYFHTNVKFTLNYEIKHDENEGNPPSFVTSAASGGGNGNGNNQNLLTTQIQFRY